ncbi:hypothetical protein N2152v2_010352 [Parachlorella kessleri]
MDWLAKFCHPRAFGRGVRDDICGRLPWYKDDWQEGLRQKLRILAPATYIFCASAIPALAFGEQMSDETGGILSGVQVLTATAVTGITQAVVGGQPLLIVGVAEPIVLMYKYMYDFAKDKQDLGHHLFLAWCAWTCVFTAAFILVLAVLNACSYIDRFTRFAGELFGMLIAVLFMQQAIKGIRQEFLPLPNEETPADAVADEFQWRLVNGLWGLFLSFGFLLTSLWVRTARSWRFLNGRLRGLLADYGVPLLIIVWAGLSYAVRGVPEGVPRRMRIPNTWNVKDTWTVAGDMGAVSGKYVAAALIPAAIIALLFYFDHSVSSQLAQQPGFNLIKPSAYHYDFLLLGFMTVLCGLLGLPPVNGVLPQSPMHSKALSSIQKKPKATPEAVGKDAPGFTCSHGSAPRLWRASLQPPVGPPTVQHDPLHHSGLQPGGLQHDNGLQPDGLRLDGSQPGGLQPDVLQPIGLRPVGVQPAGAQGLDSPTCPDCPTISVGDREPPIGGGSSNGSVGGSTGYVNGSGLHVSPSQVALVPEKGYGGATEAGKGEAGSGGGEVEVVPIKVSEQRLSGLLQSLGVAACLGATPAIKLIPTSVLWGYFAFMAIESLGGMQFWERLLLLGTDPSRRYIALEAGHHPYLETVPFRTIAAFTLLQALYTGAVYGLTWAGIPGCLFPVPIMLLVPIRQYVMPRLFRPEHLQELDAMEEEEAPPLPHDQAMQEAAETGMGPASQQQQQHQGQLAEEEDALGDVIERETSRLRVVRHVPRTMLELRRHSALVERSGSGSGAGGGGAGSSGHMHDV